MIASCTSSIQAVRWRFFSPIQDGYRRWRRPWRRVQRHLEPHCVRRGSLSQGVCDRWRAAGSSGVDRGGLGCGQMPLRGVCWGGMGSWAVATDAWVLVVRRWGTLV